MALRIDKVDLLIGTMMMVPVAGLVTFTVMAINDRAAPTPELGPSHTAVVPHSTDHPPMVSITNQYREGRGLSPLGINSKLTRSAQAKADTLCETGEWSHDAGSEKFYMDIKRAGYDYSRSGENLAKGYVSASAAFDALIASPSHQENIMGDYDDIGVGRSECGGKNYYAIHYGAAK